TDLSDFTCSEKMESVAKALEEVLMCALPQGCITVGVYEAAKALNVYVSDHVFLGRRTLHFMDTHICIYTYIHIHMYPTPNIPP
uniref:Uncharacterized protein n=1 Tax=Gouania willdenowi TaxID=441366 RepID=A0A8C5DSJ4_GOUWI